VTQHLLSCKSNTGNAVNMNARIFVHKTQLIRYEWLWLEQSKAKTQTKVSKVKKNHTKPWTLHGM